MPYNPSPSYNPCYALESVLVTVHGVLALAMDAGPPRQQARNCGLEQRVSPDLKQRVSLDLEQRVSPCQSPPKIFPEFLPSAGSRWILIPPRGMGCLPPMNVREATRGAGVPHR
jgi:hypothetical protein